MKGTLKGAALGALVASAAALLLAPKSGKKTRADVNKFLTTASKDLEKKIKKMQSITQQQYEELFLNSLAQAAKKKEEITDVLEDVSAVLKKGWSDARQELKKSKTSSRTKSK